MSYDHRRPAIAASQAREDGNLDYLLDLLNDPEAHAREQAAYNLGKLGDRRAVPALARRLGATSASLRLKCLGALATIGEDSVADDVYEVATKDSVFLVRTVAVSTLVSLGDRRASGVVISMLDDPGKRDAGRFWKWALEILVNSGDPSVIPVLEAHVQKTGIRDRRRIRHAIAHLRAATG